MPQLHFSVSNATAQALAEEAKRADLSISAYLAQVLTRQLPTTWPTGYLAAVVGCCHEAPLPDPEEPSGELDEIDL